MSSIIKQNTRLFFLAIALVYGCGNEKKAEKGSMDAPVKVTVRKVDAAELPEEFFYSGSIEADISVAMGFSVPGRVISVNVQEGQRVSAGQLLASIETVDYNNAFQIAKASEEQAQDNFNRLNELHSKGSLPERDFITVKTALVQAKANTSLAKKKLTDTRLYAPYAGIVSAKMVERGAMVAPGQPAFTLLKTDQVYATVSVAEGEISHLSIGKTAMVEIPALKTTVQGSIDIINPQADNTSKTYAVKIRLKNNAGKLLPGMIANLNIKTGINKQGISVPASSIVRDQDELNYVFVLDKEQKTAIKRRISPAGVTGNNEVMIKSGINPGDHLVVSGQTNLKDGSKVQF